MDCKIHGKDVPFRVNYHKKNSLRAERVSYTCRLCESERPIDYKTRKRATNKFYYKLLAAIEKGKWAVEIDARYIEKILSQQNNKCALSGIFFTDLFPPSIDRIDSTKGYIEGNVQLVLKEINTMKMDLPQSLFLLLVHSIAKTRPEP
jgi:hypothetical protein